jgi:antitoxin component YwqK of YwqJK toxin-antitoxin module
MEKRLNQLDEKDRLHGVWEDYYFNGKLRWRTPYHHCKRHGIAEDYYLEGTPRWKGNYHHGTLKGVEKFWGNPQKIEIFKGYHLVIK